MNVNIVKEYLKHNKEQRENSVVENVPIWEGNIENLGYIAHVNSVGKKCMLLDGNTIKRNIVLNIVNQITQIRLKELLNLLEKWIIKEKIIQDILMAGGVIEKQFSILNLINVKFADIKKEKVKRKEQIWLHTILMVIERIMWKIIYVLFVEVVTILYINFLKKQRNNEKVFYNLLINLNPEIKEVPQHFLFRNQLILCEVKQ